MRQVKWQVFLGLILFLNCNSAIKNKPAPSKPYFWIGRIDAATPLFMWAVIKNGIVQGEVTYMSKIGNKPVKLLGRTDKKGAMRVSEYLADGKITGSFVFDQISDRIVGKWESSNDKNKVYPVDLSAKDTMLPTIDTSFEPKMIPGDYAYLYGEKGAEGVISIKQDPDRQNLFDIECSTSDPVSHSNMSDQRSIIVKNNECTYTIQGLATCSFRIKFYNNFLTVDYLKNYGDTAEHSGTYPDVAGIYYKSRL